MAFTDLKEVFGYDSLNRLETVNLSVSGAVSVTTLSLNYDEAGNITYKSDVGTYLYDGAQPHAVSSASKAETPTPHQLSYKTYSHLPY